MRRRLRKVSASRVSLRVGLAPRAHELRVPPVLSSARRRQRVSVSLVVPAFRREMPPPPRWPGALTLEVVTNTPPPHAHTLPPAPRALAGRPRRAPEAPGESWAGRGGGRCWGGGKSSWQGVGDGGRAAKGGEAGGLTAAEGRRWAGETARGGGRRGGRLRLSEY